MINFKNKSDCSGCHACASICPKNCIEMRMDAEGFAYPYIDTKTCIRCGRCEQVCPVLHPAKKTKTERIALAAYTRDETVRVSSSSGGIFTELAKEIISSGGVVFGAAFDGSFALSHTCVSTEAELAGLRGSKYLQSRIGDSYVRAKEFLDRDIPVLFTGTPCQIGGLYAYLGRDYDNLVTQDLICHGVPSPLVWKKYLKEQENKHKGRATGVCFRDKTLGWKKFSVTIDFFDKTPYCKMHREDPYMSLFQPNFVLRPSCYHCAFKEKYRQSDITLADFWGIQNVLPQMDDDGGTSLVVLHSEKAKQLFEQIKNNCVFAAVDLDEAIKYNPSMISSARMPEKRNAVMRDFGEKTFRFVAKKYVSVGLLRRAILCVKRSIRRQLIKHG